ncbi:MAG: hypothetical protein R6V52_07870 [Bacteroidales bacterium]
MKKKTFILLAIASILWSCNLKAQDTFNYSVIKDDPNVGNNLYAGIGVFPVIWQPMDDKYYDGDFEVGLTINSFNVFEHYYLSLNSYFDTGLGAERERVAPLTTNYPTYPTEDILFNITNLTVTRELAAFVNTKNKPIDLFSTSDSKIVSNVDHKVKSAVGFRLGYGYTSLPMDRIKKIDTLDNGNGIYVYGVEQHSLNIGLSLTNLVNVQLMTDLFGEIKKKSVFSIYADAMLIMKNKPYFYDKTDQRTIDYTPSEDANMGISYRIGFEHYYSYPKISLPLAVKYGFEIVNHDFYDINSVNSSEYYLRAKLAILFSK